MDLMDESIHNGLMRHANVDSDFENDNDNVNLFHSSSHSSGTLSGNETADSSLTTGIGPYIYGMHSDFTVPTSNLRRYIDTRVGKGIGKSDQFDSLSPPTDLTTTDSDHLTVSHLLESNSIINSLQSSTTIKHTNTGLNGVDVAMSPLLSTYYSEGEQQQQQRRHIFNMATQKKYSCGTYHHNEQHPSQLLNEDEQVVLSTLWDGNIPPQHQTSGGHSLSNSNRSTSSSRSSKSFQIPFYTSLSNGIWAPINTPVNSTRNDLNFQNDYSPTSQTSQLMTMMNTTRSAPSRKSRTRSYTCCRWCNTKQSQESPHVRRKRQHQIDTSIGDISDIITGQNNFRRSSVDQRHDADLIHRTREQPDTRHAQALILGCAFAAIWSGCNITAPNLTAMANDFGFYSDSSRDWYLGSVLAIVQTIASLPVAAAIGLLTDVVASRQRLFVSILIVGSASSALGAISWRSYYLLVLSRWLSGGCMAGSVPVAFSLLSDWFDATERNIASSGLTALMGLGIVGGQVYAGIATSSSTSDTAHWTHAFVASAIVQIVFGVLCMYLVHDPVRGGREAALQALMKEHGTAAYDRPMTWSSLRHAIWNNASNAILLWQGFFTSIPWGVMFVFLNDFLSQERGFTVPDATFLVAVFGAGGAAGGIIGGYVGQVIMERYDRSYLPLFMATTTVLGIVPFVWLLNSTFLTARSIRGIALVGMGGLIASLPSVLVRPCILNVNPPETRGAAMTTANLLVQLGRGIGPTCISAIQTIGNLIVLRYNATTFTNSSTIIVDRKFAFNLVIVVFWIISAIQLLFLMKTLPQDQDSMEADLAKYAAERATLLSGKQNKDELNNSLSEASVDDPNGNLDTNSIRTTESVVPLLVSVQERMNSFDNVAAQQTIQYVRAGMQELQFSPFGCHINTLHDVISPPSSHEDECDTINDESPMEADMDSRRVLWYNQDSNDRTTTNWTDESLHSPSNQILNTNQEQENSTNEGTPLLYKPK
jgi:MFS family permease